MTDQHRAYLDAVNDWLRPVGVEPDERRNDVDLVPRARAVRPGSMYNLVDDLLQSLILPFTDPHEVLASHGRFAAWAIAAPPWTWRWAAGLLWTVVDSLPPQDRCRNLSVTLRSPVLHWDPDGCDLGMTRRYGHGDEAPPTSTGAGFAGEPFGTTDSCADLGVHPVPVGADYGPVLRRPISVLSAALVALAHHESAEDLAATLMECVQTLDKIRPWDTTLPTGSEVVAFAWVDAFRLASFRRHDYLPVTDQLVLAGTSWAAYAADVVAGRPDARQPDPNMPARITEPLYPVDAERWLL